MRDVLQSVAEFLNGKGLIAGYTLRYYRWRDDDVSTKVLVIRNDGGGESDIHLQQPQFQILLLEGPDTVTEGDDRASAIVRALRESEGVPDGVVRFDAVGVSQGPFYLDDGRAFFRAFGRAFVEGV